MKCTRNFSRNSLISEYNYLLVNYSQNSPQYIKLKRQAREAIQKKRIFYVYGTCEEVIRQSLRDKGWVEKIPHCRMNFHSVMNTEFKDQDEKRKQVERVLLSKLVNKAYPNLVWNADTYQYDYCIDNNQVMYNRLKTGAVWTSKDGLCTSIRNHHWYHIEGVAEINIPRTYTNFDNEETDAFITDYRLTACTSLLKWSLVMVTNNQSIAALTGKIELTVYVFALNRCKEFLNYKQNKDIDTASAPVVNDNQWNLFLDQVNLLIEKQTFFKFDTEKKLPLYLCYAKVLLKEMVKYRPQLTCDGFKNIWIIKPVNFCRGFGIQLASDFDTLCRIQYYRGIKKVFQKYIEEPLLIYETKFDIRQYYLVTSTYPMVIWIYHDCYIKLSTQKYNVKDYHESIHLTNYAVQSKYPVSENRNKNLPDCNMWSMDTFKAYLVKIGKPDVWRQVIYPGMRKSIVSVMLTCQETIDHGKNRFELYGCDFILDNTYQPWLIEVNCCPDLNPSTEITAKLCPQVAADLLKVVFDHSADPKTPTGKFCCIYRQSYFLPPYVYCKANNFLVRGLALPNKYFYRTTVQINEQIYNDVEDSNFSNNNEIFNTLKTVYEFDSKGENENSLTDYIMTDQKMAEMDQALSERVILTSAVSDENLKAVAPIITDLLDDIMDRIMPPASCPNANNITILTKTHVSSENDLTENNIGKTTTTAALKIARATSFEELKIEGTRSLSSLWDNANLNKASTEIIHPIQKYMSEDNHYNYNCVTQSTSATLIEIDRSTSPFKINPVNGIQIENPIKRMSFGSMNEINLTDFMTTTWQTHKSITPHESYRLRIFPSILNRIIFDSIENLKTVALQITDRIERITSESDEIKKYFPLSTPITTIKKYSETTLLKLISAEINSTGIAKKELKLNENHAQITDQKNCLLDIFPYEYDKTKDEVINSTTTRSLTVHKEKNNVNKFKLNPITTKITSGMETVVQQTACEEHKSINFLECDSEKATIHNLESNSIKQLTLTNDLSNNKLTTTTNLEISKSTSLFESSCSLKRKKVPGTLQRIWRSYEDSITSSPSIKGLEGNEIRKNVSENDLKSIISSKKATGMKFTINKTDLFILIQKLLTSEEDFQEIATVLEKRMNSSGGKEKSKTDVTLVNAPKLLKMTMSQPHKKTNTSVFTSSESSFLKETKENLKSDGELTEEATVLANQTDEIKNQMNCNCDTCQTHITKLSKSVGTTKHEENNCMEIAPLKIYEAEITRRILKSREKLVAVVSALKSRMSILVNKKSFMNNHSEITKLKKSMSENHKITKYDRHSHQEIGQVKLVGKYLKTVNNVCDNIVTDFKEDNATKLTRLCDISKHKGTSCLDFTLLEKPQAILQEFLKISQELDDVTTAIIRQLYDITYQMAIRNSSTTKNSAKKTTEVSLLQSSLQHLPIQFTEQISKSVDLFASNEVLAQLDEFLCHVTSSSPTVCRSGANYSSFSSVNILKKSNSQGTVSFPDS